MFKWFLRVFVQGLAAMIPTALTIAVIVWLGIMVEGLFSLPLKGIMPSGPDLLRTLKGIVFFVVIVFLFGLLMKLWLVRHLFDWFEARIISIPLVKTVYSSIKDVMHLLGGKGTSKGDMVVMVTLDNGWRQLGIVTRQNFSTLPPELINGDPNLIAVYVPFSYQLGGFTYFIDRRQCQPVPGMSVEDAMRVSIMAWVGSDGKSDPAKTPPVQTADATNTDSQKG